MDFHKQKIEKLGDYKIISELGRGGMGVVYKVWDTKLKRTLALKTLASTSQNMELQRFIVETKAISQLNHPNIVKLYTTGEEQGVYFYTMDFIEGTRLDHFVKNNKVSLRKITLLMQKIAKAIYYAHQQGIVHRDLKPANIVVDKNEVPHILDFGLAKVASEEYHLTQSGDVLGTPFFMSPEQAQSKHSLVNHSSDIYSLGAILYFLITDVPPFEGKSLIEILYKIVHKVPIAPRKLAPDIPQKLEDICLYAMAKERHKRYPSALQLANDLHKFHQGKNIVATKKQRSLKLRKLCILLLFFVVLSYGALKLFFSKEDQKITSTSLKKLENLQKIPPEERSFRYAKNLFELKFYERARENFAKTLAAPGKIDINAINSYLVLIFVELKRYQKALKAHKKLPANLKNPAIDLAMAKTHYDLGNFTKTQFFLDKISSLKATIKAEVWFYYGLLNYQNQNYNKALVYFIKTKKAVAPDADYFPMLLFHIGVCHAKEQQFKKSIPFLQQAQKHLLDAPFVYEHLGKSFLALGNHQEAIKNFQKCIKLRPEKSMYYSHLAECQYLLERYIDVDKTLRKALELDAANFKALEYMMRLVLKKPSIQNDCFAVILHYISRSVNIKPPDLFLSQFRQIKRIYQSSYIKWKVLQNPAGSPHIFLKILKSDNKKPKIYNGAIQGLTSLRYLKGIEKNIALALGKKISKKAKIRIQKALKVIKEKKQREQKHVAYYRLAYFYLTWQFPNCLITQNGLDCRRELDENAPERTHKH